MNQRKKPDTQESKQTPGKTFDDNRRVTRRQLQMQLLNEESSKNQNERMDPDTPEQDE